LRHREVAERIGMTPDAFSRALHGKRQFSSIELARLADLTAAGVGLAAGLSASVIGCVRRYRR
jgi:transcriptional regulator with XRE-family HTH domain